MNEFSIVVSVAGVVALLAVFVRGTRRAKIAGVSVVLLLMGYVLHFGVRLAIRRSSFPVTSAHNTVEYRAAWWAGATQVQQRVDDLLGAVYVLAVVLGLMAMVKERVHKNNPTRVPPEPAANPINPPPP